MNTPFRFRRRALFALAGALTLVQTPAALAQEYPSKSITWLVGQPAGGSVDVLTRLVARQIEQTLGQPVVVENRPGASGGIALQAVAKAGADGYTIITVPGPVLTHTPMPQVGRELVGVATLARGPMVLVGTRAAPMPGTLAELLAAARKDSRAFSFASSGNGTSQHLAGELMNRMAHTQIMHIPYKGGSQAVTDVVGGQVPLGMLGVPPVLPHIKSGKLVAYGVSSATRLQTLPDVPTLREAGLPEFEADQWFVVAAPTGVPPERLRKLNGAIAQALQKPEIQAAYIGAGVTPSPASPEQTTAFVHKEIQRWQALAQQAKLPLD